FQKALRGLENGLDGLDERADLESPTLKETLQQELRMPKPERLLYVADAFRAGYSIDQLYELTAIDPWFLAQIEELVRIEVQVKSGVVALEDKDQLFRLKRRGFSDARLAKLTGRREADVRVLRHERGVRPVYKRVDSCAAE